MNKVLMYHSIGSQANKEIGASLYAVPENNFRQQMEYLKSLGTVPCPSTSLGTPVGRGDSPLISFDDGLLDNYSIAYPILKEQGLKAYFFVTVLKIGTPGYMNWQQIKELRDSAMLIGSHGMNHRILTELNDRELDYELRKSKKIIEDNLGQPVDYFSVPRGFYNKKVIEKAKEVGYKAIFTSGIKDNDGFKLGRIPVKASWDLEYFAKVITNGVSLKDKAGEMIRNSSKAILGAKYYDKLRTTILKR